MQKHTTYPQKINISNRKISIFKLEKNNILTKKYMFLPKQKEQSFDCSFILSFSLQRCNALHNVVLFV